MRHAVMTVHDTKAGAFARPFFVPTVGIGIRSFGATCEDENSELHRYSADMFLYHLAWYDDMDGTFENVVPPKQVAKAADFIGVVQATPELTRQSDEGDW